MPELMALICILAGVMYAMIRWSGTNHWSVPWYMRDIYDDTEERERKKRWRVK